MNEQALIERVHQSFLRDSEKHELDSILEAALIEAIAYAIGWLVRRCLNANLDVVQLHKVLVWACRKAERNRKHGLTKGELYRLYGDRLARAIVVTRNGLKRREMLQLQQQFPQSTFANAKVLPDDND